MTGQKVDAIARIIEPEAMRKYEEDLGGSPTWDQLVAFSTVKVARQKAEAIIALLLPPPACTEAAGNYSDRDDPRTNPHPI